MVTIIPVAVPVAKVKRRGYFNAVDLHSFAKKTFLAALLATCLLARAVPGLPEDVDHVAWGHIERTIGDGQRILVVPDKGRFIEGAEVSLYEKSRLVCSGVVQSAYKDSAYVGLEEACREAKFVPGELLVTMGTTYHEISRNFTEWEAAGVTSEMKRKVAGVPGRVKAVSVRMDGKQGLSVSFALLDSADRLTASDGTAEITVVSLGDSGGESREEVLVRHDTLLRLFDPSPPHTGRPGKGHPGIQEHRRHSGLRGSPFLVLTAEPSGLSPHPNRRRRSTQGGRPWPRYRGFIHRTPGSRCSGAKRSSSAPTKTPNRS